MLRNKFDTGDVEYDVMGGAYYANGDDVTMAVDGSCRCSFANWAASAPAAGTSTIAADVSGKKIKDIYS